MDKRRIKPIGPNVLVELVRAGTTKTKGGIELPESAQPKKTTCTVVAVGKPFDDSFEMPVKEGDQVVLTPNGRLNPVDPQLDPKDDKLFICSVVDIIAVTGNRRESRGS